MQASNTNIWVESDTEQPTWTWINRASKRHWRCCLLCWNLFTSSHKPQSGLQAIRTEAESYHKLKLPWDANCSSLNPFQFLIHASRQWWINPLLSMSPKRSQFCIIGSFERPNVIYSTSFSHILRSVATASCPSVDRNLCHLLDFHKNAHKGHTSQNLLTVCINCEGVIH